MLGDEEAKRVPPGVVARSQACKHAERERLWAASTGANTERLQVPRLRLDRPSGDWTPRAPARSARGASTKVYQTHRRSRLNEHFAGQACSDWAEEMRNRLDCGPRQRELCESARQTSVPVTSVSIARDDRERHRAFGIAGPPGESEDSIMLYRVGAEWTTLPSFGKLDIRKARATRPKVAGINPVLLGSLPGTVPRPSQHPASQISFGPAPASTSQHAGHCNYDPVRHIFHQGPSAAPACGCPRDADACAGLTHKREHVERVDSYLPSGRQLSRHRAVARAPDAGVRELVAPFANAV